MLEKNSGVYIHRAHCADVSFSIDSVSVTKCIFLYVRVIDTDTGPNGGTEGDHRVPVILVGLIPEGYP